MKTVWCVLTLMADSVHYFSHNVAFFFFSFYLELLVPKHTVTHTFTAHLFTTRKDLSQKYTIRTSNSDTCIAAFSFFLSRPCYSFFSLLFDKVNTLSKQRGKTGNITKYVMCVWVTTIGASDWEQQVYGSYSWSGSSCDYLLSRTKQFE